MIAACSSAETGTTGPSPSGLPPTMATDTPGTTLSPSTTTASPATTSPTSVTTTAPTPGDTFFARIGSVTEARLGHSWHSGCPVDAGDLRLVQMSHWDLDGRVHLGELVVRAEQARGIVHVFEFLFYAGYPIESMTPIGDLPQGAEDQAGYNNTSGYHCRFAKGTNHWSQHAMGQAVDINPMWNPYLSGTTLWPEGSDRYLDRGLSEPGMIQPDGPVVAAFAEIGWSWGGYWQTLKDYHHFSATGT